MSVLERNLSDSPIGIDSASRHILINSPTPTNRPQVVSDHIINGHTISRGLPSPYLHGGRHIDQIVNNVLAALEACQASDLSLIYTLTRRLNSIFHLQRLYIIASGTTYADEVVSLTVLEKVVSVFGNPNFVGWQKTGVSYSGLLCQELELRTIVSGLRLLRYHGVAVVSNEVLNIDLLEKNISHNVMRTIGHRPDDSEVRNSNIDFLLAYIKNFTHSLPKARTSAQELATRVLFSVPAVIHFQRSELFERLEVLEELSEVVQAGKLDLYNLYIHLDNLVWNLIEWHRQKVGGIAQGHDQKDTDADGKTMLEAQIMLISYLTTIIYDQLDATDSGDFEVVNFPDENNTENRYEDASTRGSAMHFIHGVLDLLQYLATEYTSKEPLTRIYEIAVRVVKSVKTSDLRCKAFDVLSILIHKGIVAAVQVDSELRSLNLSSQIYFDLLEEKDRSNAVHLTRRRLEEQSEMQEKSIDFGLPPTPIESEHMDVSKIARQQARNSAPPLLDVGTRTPIPYAHDSGQWQNFLAQLELELVCEGRKDGIPADDLGIMTCGCVLSEAFAETKLEFTNICPSCGYPTEFKKPHDKLRRISRLVADKKAELGIVEISTGSFDTLSTPPAEADNSGDESPSERDSMQLPIQSNGEAAIASPDNMVFGSPGQGGGFPKEMMWDDPSIKYTPETLQQLFGEQMTLRKLQRNTEQNTVSSSLISNPSEPSSRQSSITSTMSGDAGPSRRPRPVYMYWQDVKPGMLELERAAATRPSIQTQLSSSDMNYSLSKQPYNPALGRTPSGRTQSIPIRSMNNHGDPTRSVSPSRYGNPASSPQRFAASNSRTMQFEGSNPNTSSMQNSYFNNNLQQPRTDRTSPNQSRQDVSTLPFGGRKRAPSYPNDPSMGTQVSSSYGSSIQKLNSAGTFQIDDDSNSSLGDYNRSRNPRTPIDGNNRIENWITRNPNTNNATGSFVDAYDEKRHASFNKSFPYCKAEYVHHIQTGGRLRFNDIIATSIAKNCSKFVLLEKKKFKVYSILASDKMPELLCGGKSTGEYGSHLELYNNISPEDRVIGKQSKWEYLMAECSDRFLAIAGTQGTLKVHNLANDGQPIYTYVSELYDIRCMAISGDGQTIALGVITSEYGKEVSQIILHNINIDHKSNPSGKAMDPIKVTLPYGDPMGTMSFSDDSTYLTCSTLREPRFLVYDLAVPNQTPKLVMKSSRKLDISHDAEGITSVKFFPGNRLLCVTSVAANAFPIVVDSNIGVLDPNSGAAIQKIGLVSRLNKVGDKVHSCCVSPTSTSLCVLDRSGNILIVYFPQGFVNDEGRRPRVVKVAKVQGATKMSEAASICFSPEGHRLIIVDRKADVTIVDFAEADESKMTKSTPWE